MPAAASDDVEGGFVFVQSFTATMDQSENISGEQLVIPSNNQQQDAVSRQERESRSRHQTPSHYRHRGREKAPTPHHSPKTSPLEMGDINR